MNQCKGFCSLGSILEVLQPGLTLPFLDNFIGQDDDDGNQTPIFQPDWFGFNNLVQPNPQQQLFGFGGYSQGYLENTPFLQGQQLQFPAPECKRIGTLTNQQTNHSSQPIPRFPKHHTTSLSSTAFRFSTNIFPSTKYGRQPLWDCEQQ